MVPFEPNQTIRLSPGERGRLSEAKPGGGCHCRDTGSPESMPEFPLIQQEHRTRHKAAWIPAYAAGTHNPPLYSATYSRRTPIRLSRFPLCRSFPRKRESSYFFWIPACAGMTRCPLIPSELPHAQPETPLSLKNSFDSQHSTSP